MNIIYLKSTVQTLLHYNLQQHLVSHAELRPYVCEYCDAGFTTSQSLKFHLRTHKQVGHHLLLLVKKNTLYFLPSQVL